MMLLSESSCCLDDFDDGMLEMPLNTFDFLSFLMVALCWLLCDLNLRVYGVFGWVCLGEFTGFGFFRPLQVFEPRLW